jgi:integrase
VSLQSIRPALVQAYLDGMAGKPGKQAASLSAIKQVSAWAERPRLSDARHHQGLPVRGVGRRPYPLERRRRGAGEKHARPDIARVVTLGANTGQRGSDLIRMGWSDIEVYKGTRGSTSSRRKPAAQLWIPITAALAAHLDTWEKRPARSSRSSTATPGRASN